MEAQPEWKSHSGRTAKKHFDPIVREIEGWKVHIDPTMLDGEYSAEGTRALTMLAGHLQRIAIMIPQELKEHDPVLHDLLEEIWGVEK